MRLWVMSDIHLELTRGWDLPAGETRPDFDVLVVAGDLIPRAERGVKWLLERVPDRPVVYVMGNHEAYGTDIDRTVEKAKAAAAGSNVHVLENETVNLAGATFAGATLWTDFAVRGDAEASMALARERMNDFKKIRVSNYERRFLPHHALSRHRASVSFLEEQMRRPRGEERLIVVTHHAPLPRLHADPDGSEEDPRLDPAYRSDLRRLMTPGTDEGPDALRPADLWIYGHTHESFDTTAGSTRVVSNAKGYGPWPPRERTWDNPAFDERLVVEV